MNDGREQDWLRPDSFTEPAALQPGPAALFQLRPLSLGEVLDRTFTLYRSHFWLFASLSAISAGAEVVAQAGALVLKISSAIGEVSLPVRLELSSKAKKTSNSPSFCPRLNRVYFQDQERQRSTLYRLVSLGASQMISVRIKIRSASVPLLHSRRSSCKSSIMDEMSEPRMSA